jgi:hypothetical protein
LSGLVSSRTLLAAGMLLLGLLTLHGVVAAPAHAAGPAVIGGGSGIIIDAQYECTVTTIGHDSAGRLVGLTAGHCGDAGSRVLSEADPWIGQIGQFVYANHDLDYAVIQFDPAKVIPVRRVGDVTIDRLGGPAQFPQVVCKRGRTTATTCGVAWGDVFATGIETWTQLCVIEGDSGAPVVRGDTLVGMVNAYLTVACAGPEVGTDMSAIVRDLDAHHRIGAGYHPI